MSCLRDSLCIHIQPSPWKWAATSPTGLSTDLELQSICPQMWTLPLYTPNLCFAMINHANELITYEWNDETLYKAFNELKNTYVLVTL